MDEVLKVSPTMLKEHEKASALIPEMTDEEWDKFFSNVQEVGIRQPLDINTNYEVLDGRHRLRAALKLNLNKIEVRQHELTADEEMKFVRDTAIERRHLTDEQRLNIVLEADELIKSIYDKGKNSQGERSDIKTFSSVGEKVKQPHNSVKQVAELAGTSENKVSKMKKLKKENPESYDEVVAGKSSLYKAYNDLPTVVNNHEENRARKKEVVLEGNQSPEVTKHKEPNDHYQEDKNLYSFENKQVSEEEKKRLMLSSKSLSLKDYLKQITALVDETDNLFGVIGLEFDDELYGKAKESMKKIIKYIEKQESALNE